MNSFFTSSKIDLVRCTIPKQAVHDGIDGGERGLGMRVIGRSRNYFIRRPRYASGNLVKLDR